jgi:hypothetical protein
VADNTQHNFQDIVFKVTNYFDYKRKQKEVEVVPFYPTAWDTTKIFYDCDFCFKGPRLKSGEAPYYCAHPDYVLAYITLGAKPSKCKNCPFYKQR